MAGPRQKALKQLFNSLAKNKQSRKLYRDEVDPEGLAINGFQIDQEGARFKNFYDLPGLYWAEKKKEIPYFTGMKLDRNKIVEGRQLPTPPEMEEVFLYPRTGEGMKPTAREWIQERPGQVIAKIPTPNWKYAPDTGEKLKGKYYYKLLSSLLASGFSMQEAQNLLKDEDFLKGENNE